MSQVEYEHDEQEVEYHWMKDEQAIQDILQRGAQSVIETEHQEHKELPCSCIDERVGGFKLAVPGSGILETEDEAIRILKESGATSISSHEDCGAAALAFEKLSPEEKDQYGTPEQYAIEWAKGIAKKLGIEYAGHKQVETPGLHVARVIYYDASGDFQADAPGNPHGFTVSRKFLNLESAQNSLGLSIKIATGDHGMGNKFTAEKPLLIIPIGGSEQEIDAARQEIDQVLKQDPITAERIRVDHGVVMGREKEQVAA